MSQLTSVEIAFSYRRRRQGRVALLLLFVGSVALILWSIGRSMLVDFVGGAAGVLAFALMDYIVWRCPSCHRSLGKAFDYGACPNCRATFSVDDHAAA